MSSTSKRTFCGCRARHLSRRPPRSRSSAAAAACPRRAALLPPAVLLELPAHVAAESVDDEWDTCSAHAAAKHTLSAVLPLHALRVVTLAAALPGDREPAALSP